MLVCTVDTRHCVVCTVETEPRHCEAYKGTRSQNNRNNLSAVSRATRRMYANTSYTWYLSVSSYHQMLCYAIYQDVHGICLYLHTITSWYIAEQSI